MFGLLSMIFASLAKLFYANGQLGW